MMRHPAAYRVIRAIETPALALGAAVVIAVLTPVVFLFLAIILECLK